MRRFTTVLFLLPALSLGIGGVAEAQDPAASPTAPPGYDALPPPSPAPQMAVEDDESGTSPGRGLKISGMILACLGGTGFVVAAVASAANFSISFSGASRDETPYWLAIGASVGTAALGLALLIAGSVRARRARSRTYTLVPTVAPTADGEGAVLAAAGTF